ncbi:MAG TPA: sigma-54-dependent Fis family transcriptional regulator [Deltaproteobacteria bacterium]|nr:sigma-54-dependent Fis family transcriptional regulator [Deltaproteobacteria bacterium]
MNILIVDDQEENRYFLEVLLKGHGHDVQSSPNGVEALEKLRAGWIDLIISDILMPVMDGFQLCREVKTDSDLRHIPFIIYTSTYISGQDEEFAMKIGANRFIVKPCEPEVFIESIQEVMATVREPGTVSTVEPLQDDEMLMLYNERLVRKLEEKVSQLEKEIQERSKIEDALRTSERTLRTVFESAVDGILIADGKSGRFVMANNAMCHMLGCSAEEIERLSVADVHPAKDLDKVKLQFQKLVHGELSLSSDVAVKRRDGSVFLADVNSAPFELDGNPHLLSIFRDITDRKRSEKELKKAFNTIKVMKEKLEAENIYLRDEIELKDGHGDIIATSDPMKYAIHRIRQAARTDVTVLLTGETGTGKDIFARFLHRESTRRDKPFVNVNCASLPANLIESELFGREKGAFTGSTVRQIGRFELAHGGTIFLNEIGELPIELQAKLLRVIEDGEFEYLGSPYPVKVDVRVIASTNRNLEKEIKNGRFREDLFYRINVFPVTLAPLRQRKEDIPLLVEFFTGRFSKRYGKRIETIAQDSMKTLEDYTWPGNVRELINVIERAVIVSSGPELRITEHLMFLPVDSERKTVPQGDEAQEPKGLVDMERDYILKALHQTGWRIEGERGAARVLRMNPSTLRSRMRKLDIERP